MQKVIDSHFHIWRQKDQPWLVGPMVPRIFGPYEPIRRDYPIEEFLADQKGSGVEKAVYVQTNWAKEDFEKEVAFLSETAKRDRLAACDRRLCRHDRGRRQAADRPAEEISAAARRAHAASLARDAGLPLCARSADQVIDPTVRECGAAEGLWPLLRPAAFPGADAGRAASLSARIPETDFILTHTGMLTDLDETVGRSGRRVCARSPRRRTSMRNFPAWAHSFTATIRTDRAVSTMRSRYSAATG